MATKKKAPEDQARRDQYACAVLMGIYASQGAVILRESNDQLYAGAQEQACKVAFDQADKCMGEAS